MDWVHSSYIRILFCLDHTSVSLTEVARDPTFISRRGYIRGVHFKIWFPGYRDHTLNGTIGCLGWKCFWMALLLNDGFILATEGNAYEEALGNKKSYIEVRLSAG